MTPTNSPTHLALDDAAVAEASVGLAMLNAVARQQADGVTASAATVMAVSEMLSLETVEFGSIFKQQLEKAQHASAASANALAETPPGNAPAATGEASAAQGAPAGAAPSQLPQDMVARMFVQTAALRVQDMNDWLRQLQTIAAASFALALLAQASTGDPDSGRTPGLYASIGETVITTTYAFEAHFEKMGHLVSQFLQGWPGTGKDGSAGEGTSDNLLQARNHALSIALENAVVNQQQMNARSQAATVMGVSTLYSLDTAATGKATEEALDPSAPASQPQESPAPVG